MRRFFSLLLIGFLGVAPITAVAAAAPTTAPGGDGVSSLIHQLGDPHYRVRNEATVRLHEIGRSALPALKRAVNDSDPEIQLRAARLVRILEYRHVPGRPLHHDHERNCKITTAADTGRRTIDVNDEGRTIQITEVNGRDIQMTVKGYIDGRPAQQTYKAANAQDLQFNEPEAYVVYERWASGVSGFEGMANNVVGQANANVIVMPVVQPAMVIQPGGDDIEGLTRRLETQMKQAGLTEPQKIQVRDALNRVEENSGINSGGTADEISLQMSGYDKACDHLRKVLADFHLPDPGAALPPPPSVRLGISVGIDPLTHGMVVSHVNPDSRADRMGLEEDDAIIAVNGSRPNGATELRRLVTQHIKSLVLQISRDGRDMTLKAAAQK